MNKYFFCSDIHSFYTPLMKELHRKGFDVENPEHVLVILGDVFDRGTETMEVYNFLRSLSDDRLILIRGNHESLYKSLLDKPFPDSYDFSNGTVRTFCQIAGFDEKILTSSYWYKREFIDKKPCGEYHGMPIEYWKQIKETVAMSPVTSWITSDVWKNYIETPKYICTHSWIPTSAHMESNLFQGMYKIENGYREDWRDATSTEWEDATWGCPWEKAKRGWNQTGKTIMCGHWHTSDFFNNLTRQRKDMYHNPIFKSKKYKLIGLDACTVLSGRVNVLVLNEDEL